MTPFKIKFNVGIEVQIKQHDLVSNTMQGIKQRFHNQEEATAQISCNNTLIDYIKETYLNRRVLKEDLQITLLPSLTISPNRLFVDIHTIAYTCINILSDHTYVVYEPLVGKILFIKESDVVEAIVVED